MVKPRKNKRWLDFLQGICWQFLLFIPFIATIMISAWFLFGSQMFQAFETIFYNPENEILLKPIMMLFLGIFTVFTFAPINAPTEELIFRGYVQTRLAKKFPVSLAILLSSLAFGFQHIFFASSFYGAMIYFMAFTVWGIGSGIIVHLQKRLFPVIVAHFLVNLLSTLSTLLFPLLILTGIIDL